MNKIVLLSVLLLCACVDLQKVKVDRDRLYNTGVEVCEAVICDEATVDTIRKRYGTSYQTRTDWLNFCRHRNPTSEYIDLFN